MKVISGKYKGRNIEGYNIDGTRPTMDRVKESLFATIQNYINDSIILDLFSGSGNLAIEALSMGSKYAYLNDYNKKACTIIKNNMDNMGIKDYNLLNLDYIDALKSYKDNNLQFDIIFLDPPYKTNYIEEAIKLINKYMLLKNEGIIVAESSDVSKVHNLEGLNIVKQKKYKDKWVVILKQV